MDKDFQLFPLAQRAGIGDVRIENVNVFNAPRSAQRLRRDDLLAVMITVLQGTPLTSEEIQNYLQKAADAFFMTNGSVTRALQAAAEIVNQDLLETNLHDPGGQGPTEAALNVAVWHKGSVFHAHSGETVSVCVNDAGVEIKRDTSTTSKSLGVKRAIDLQFHQTEFMDEGLLILCPQLPESWTRPALQNSHRLTPEQLKRRLANRTDIDITAGVIYVTEGRGKVGMQDWPVRAEKPALDLPQVEIQKEPEIPVIYAVDAQMQSSKTDSLPENLENPEAELEQEPFSPPINLPAHVEDMVEVQQGMRQDVDGSNKLKVSPILKPLSAAWAAGKQQHTRWYKFWARVNAKLPTGLAGKTTIFSPALMRVAVVVVPIVLALVFSAVYTSSGQTGQHQQLMKSAQDYATQAAAQKDAMLQRELWRKALENAEKAETYLTTSESTQLAALAESKLDELDLVSRLDFRPALTTMLPSDINITRMLSSSSGIYVLDSASGTLLRLFLNSKGFYELDKDFTCRLNADEVGKTGSILDFAMLPANDSNYRVLALDTTGNLLYCQPGAPAVSRTLIPPEGGWKRVIGFAYDADVLYVLDADSDHVWRYRGENPKNSIQPGIAFLQTPVSFFDEEIPDLSGAIDLAINQEDLYILHDDGHMSTCQYGADKNVQLTDCIDPIPYSDSRLGREKNPWIFMDAQFSMMQDMRMPTPAIYTLDIKNHAVVRFSFILSLERVFKARTNRNYPIPQSAPTGMMATSDQELFLAFGNQLFFAPLR